MALFGWFMLFIRLTIEFSLISLTSFLIYCLYIFYQRWKVRNIPGPPVKSFVCGHMLEFMKHSKNRYKLWLDWSHVYGPFYKVFVLHNVILVAAHPQVGKKICQNSELYPKSKDVYSQMSTLCGIRFLGASILVTVNHQRWKVKRHGLNPAFHASYLRELTATFDASADMLVDKLAERADGLTPVSILDYVGRMGIDVICDVGFGFHPQTIKDESSPFPSAVYHMLKTQSDSFQDPFFRLGINPWKWQDYKSGAQTIRFMRETGRELIRKRLASIAAGEDTGKNILNLLLKNLGHDLTEEELVDEFLTFFIAGQETTANSIAFLFMLLLKHPNILKKVYDEVDQLAAKIPNPTYDDIKTLAYLEAVWKESLRLYPPAIGTARETKRAHSIAGYKVPSGALLFIDIISSQRVGTTDGTSFRPERFLKDSELPDLCFIPFSVGQRSCIGRHFAQMEAMIVLYKLFTNFNFQLVPNQTFDIEEAMTIRLVEGVLVYLTKRSPQTSATPIRNHD